jgi:hypothetical protein
VAIEWMRKLSPPISPVGLKRRRRAVAELTCESWKLSRLYLCETKIRMTLVVAKR